MTQHYGDSAWLSLRKDIFDLLSHYKSSHGLATWEQAIEWLLAAAEEPATP
jgi:hypothetical protein